MKKIENILFVCIVAGIMGIIILYARIGFAWYVVVNPDKTIHTVEEHPYEKLTGEKVRYDIGNTQYPEKINEYIWQNGFVKKKDKDIADEKEEIEKPMRIREKIDAQTKLLAISELEKTDSEDYSFEKQKYEKIITDRKE